MDARRFAPLLVAFLVVLTTCNDAPVAPSSAGIRPAPGGMPGPNPDRPGGGGGNKGGTGGQVAGNFAIRFDGTQGTETPDSDDLDLTNTFTIEGWIKPTSPTGLGDQAMISKWGLSVSASYIVVLENDGRLALVTHDRTPPASNTKLFSAQVHTSTVRAPPGGLAGSSFVSV